MRRRGAPIWALVAALTLTAASPSGAQNPDPAAAEALFRKGIELKKSGDLAAACAAFDESARLDPAGGTLFALADCLEQQGKLATAWARFREALDIARKRSNAAKERETAARIAAIEPRLARVSVQVAPATASLPGLRVSRDGAALNSATWGLALPIDPGLHIYEATAPGKQTWSQRVEIPPSAVTLTIIVPELPDTPRSPPTASASAPPASAPPASAPPAPPPAASAPAFTAHTLPPPAPWMRTAGIGLLGVGAAALLAAGAFKLHSNAKVNEAAPYCPDGCDDRGHELYQDATTAHNIALGAAIAGGVLAAGGVVLLVLAPPSQRTTAWLGVSPSGLALGGRW